MTALWRDIVATANLLDVVEKDVPALAGTWNGHSTKEVACPVCGGKTRFHVFKGRDGIVRASCSHCNSKMNAIDYIKWRDGVSFVEAINWWALNKPTGGFGPAKPAEPPKPLPQEAIDLAMRYHNDINPHRGYFKHRGISDALIDIAKLGWCREYNRYAIPTWVGGDLWGIQYRITPGAEAVFKSEGKEVLRYFSYRGSVGMPFNTDYINSNMPYVLICEGRLDALALCSQGYPAIASPTWQKTWNKYVPQSTVILIADKDVSNTGELKALDKQDKLGKGIVMFPPEGKDAGEWIQKDLPTAKKRLERWLKLPPIN